MEGSIPPLLILASVAEWLGIWLLTRATWVRFPPGALNSEQTSVSHTDVKQKLGGGTDTVQRTMCPIGERCFFGFTLQQKTDIWGRRPMVKILDFQSSDGGFNSPRPYFVS